MLTQDFNPVHNANLKAADIINKMFGYYIVPEAEDNKDFNFNFKIIKRDAGTRDD